MREISSLTLVLSDTCNFSCPYCPQPRGKNTLRFRDIAAFLDLLQPRLARETQLGFYGGEPLLSWPLIKKTVAYAAKNSASKFRFALTSNGALLKPEHILFMKKHRFELLLSYDGLAQKKRDAGSVAAVETALENLQRIYPAEYVINSVFTPRTAPLLAASMKEMLRRGHTRLRYALDQCVPWTKKDLAILKTQLGLLIAMAKKQRQQTGRMPLENFAANGKKGIFACSAGCDRLALLPDRTVWGCTQFHHLLGRHPEHPDYGKYCLGTLEKFASRPARSIAAITANCAELRQDYFFSEKKELCALCADLERCAVCPAVAALATRIPGVIPDWTCRIRKMTRTAVAALGQPASAS
jgi:sulfatase maturation enzyme AslB (radical SAM superfamily)